jgi:hypothetical protein
MDEFGTGNTETWGAICVVQNICVGPTFARLVAKCNVAIVFSQRIAMLCCQCGRKETGRSFGLFIEADSLLWGTRHCRALPLHRPYLSALRHSSSVLQHSLPMRIIHPSNIHICLIYFSQFSLPGLDISLFRFHL